MTVDPAVEQDQVDRLNAWRSARDDASVASALRSLRAAAQAGENIMPASIAAAKAGVTTGEWAAQMRAYLWRIQRANRRGARRIQQKRRAR